jgi:hypothetical protein
MRVVARRAQTTRVWNGLWGTSGLSLWYTQLYVAATLPVRGKPEPFEVSCLCPLHEPGAALGVVAA